MYRLLSELQSYRGTGIAAKLYYESKVAEALSLVVEYQKSVQFQITNWFLRIWNGFKP